MIENSCQARVGSEEPGEILGFYSLSSTKLAADDLPEYWWSNVPAHENNRGRVAESRPHWWLILVIFVLVIFVEPSAYGGCTMGSGCFSHLVAWLLVGKVSLLQVFWPQVSESFALSYCMSNGAGPQVFLACV